MKSRILGALVLAGSLLGVTEAQAWRPTLVNIAIDGNFDDWQTVMANPNQYTFDGDGSSFTAAECLANSVDRDCPIGDTGRDIYGFAWTYDPIWVTNPAIHLYTERVSEGNNAQQNFFFIMDIKDTAGSWGGDGLAGANDFVLQVSWQPNSDLGLALFRYVPAVAGTPDPLVDGTGFADGYNMPGSLGTQVWTTTQPGQSALRMECSIPWVQLDNAPYGTAILFHVTAARNTTLPTANDNCGSPDGTIGRFGYTGIDVRPDHYGNVNSPGTIDYAHEVANYGNADDTINLFTTSSRRLQVEIWADIDGDGAIDDAIDAQMAIDGNGDGDYVDHNGVIDLLDPAWDLDADGYPDTGVLAGGSVFQVVVRLVVREGLSGLTDVTTLHGLSTLEPGEFDTARDTTAIGLITLAPAGDRMGEPGITVPHPSVVTNNGPTSDLGDFEIQGVLGWTVEIWGDSNRDGVGDVLLGLDNESDGIWDNAPGDSDGDGRPDTGVLASGTTMHVVIEVTVPTSAAIGLAENTLVSIFAASDPSDPAATPFRTTAADKVTLTPSYQESEAAFLSGAPATSVYFSHVLYNGQITADCFDFTAVSSSGWATRFWSDPNGDGSISDGEIITGTCPAVTAVEAFGGTFHLVMEVIVPNSPIGTMATFYVTAASTAPGSTATDTAIDDVKVGMLRAYRDPYRTQQARHFTNCDTVYMQAVGDPVDNANPGYLEPGTTARYTMAYIDPNGVLQDTHVVSTDGRGIALDDYTFISSALLSTSTSFWHVKLWDTEPNPDVEKNDLQLYLERSGEIVTLTTDQLRYLDLDGLVVDALLENTNTFAPYANSVLKLVVTDDSDTPTLYIDGSGHPQVYALGVSTFESDDIDLVAGAQQLEGFALASVDYPATGNYRVTAIWTLSCGPEVSRTHVPFSVVPQPPVITVPTTPFITNDPTVTVSGTKVAGAAVIVYAGASQVGSTTADGTTGWTLDTTALAEGSHVLTAIQTENGVASDPSNSVSVTIDLTGPTAPTMTTPAASPPPSNNDPVVFSGACEAGTTITLTGLAVDYTATCTAGGSWTISLAAATVGQGSHTVSVTSTDAAGNTTPMVGSRTFVVDTVAPGAPTITEPIDNAIITAPDVQVHGTAEPGTMVEIYVDGVLADTVAADSSTGEYTSTITPGDGTHIIAVIAVDAAGNASAATDVTVTIDTAEPAAPVIDAPINGQYFGAASGGDITISGRSETGTTIHLYELGVEYATAAVDGTGHWTASVQHFADGSHIVSAYAVDGAGLESTNPDIVQFFVDTAVPVAPVITAPAPGAQLNNNDVVVSGTAESGTTVHVVVDGLPEATVVVPANGVWSVTVLDVPAGDQTATATVVDAAGNTSPAATRNFTVDLTPPTAPTMTSPAPGDALNNNDVLFSGTCEDGTTIRLSGLPGGPYTTTCSGGLWTITVNDLGDGPYTVTATATDGAGNVTPMAGSVSFSVDTVAPSTPVILYPTDGLATNDPNVTLSGTCEAGSIITISGSINGSVNCNGGLWTFPVTGIAPGSYTIVVSASDLAGNTSGSATVDFTVDRTAPVAPVITAPVDNTGSAVVAVPVTGTAEPDAHISLFAGTAPVGSATTDGAGNWSTTATFPGEGTFELTAVATDAAGNPSLPSAAVTVIVDTTPPTAPVITSPTDGSTVTSAVVTVIGTAEAGASIAVYVGGVEQATTTADGSGNWSVELPPLTEGNYRITAVATDGHGRHSGDSNAINITVNLTSPAPPAITLPLDNAYLTSTTVTVAGTGVADTTITVLDDGAPAGTTTVQSNGTWTTDIVIGLGASVLTATATDAFARVSSPSNAVDVFVDTTAPLAPVIEFPLTGALFGTSTVAVSGTATPGELVTVTATPTTGPAVQGTATVANDGNWTLNLTLTEDDWSLVAVARDAGNRTSPDSNTVAISVDLTAPSAPVITLPVDGATVGSSPITVSGTAEAGATVVLFVDGVQRGTSQADGSGNWSVSNVPLVEGSNALTARATDPAGHGSLVSTPVNVTLDSTGPTAPAITAPADNAYLTTASVNVAGTGVAGDTITVYAGSDVVGTVSVPAGGSWSVDVTLPEGASVLTATATDVVGRTGPVSNAVDVLVDTSAPIAPEIVFPADGAMFGTNDVHVSGTASHGETVDVTATSASGAVLHATTVADLGVWSVDFDLAEGGWTLVAVATDAASRTSSPSNAVAIEVDLSAPEAPAILAPADNAYVTSTTVHVSGTAVHGETIAVFADGTQVGTAQVQSDGSWSVDVTLPEGASILTATATDAVDRTSPESGEVHVMVDTSAPLAPVIVVPVDGSWFDTSAVHVSGTATHGETVDVTATSDSGTVLHLTTTVAADGTWAVDFVLAESGWTLTAVATDAADRHSGNSNVVAIVVDLTAPAAPVIVEPTDESTLHTATVTVSGTAEHDATISVLVDGNAVTTTTASDGSWSVEITLTEGDHTITATATDPAGNTSAPSTAVDVTVDLSAPDAGTDAGHDAGVDAGHDAGRPDTGGTVADANGTVTQPDSGRPEDKWLMEGGCGCRTTGDRDPSAFAIGLALLGLLVLRRRAV